jgi:hypothetical protein
MKLRHHSGIVLVVAILIINSCAKTNNPKAPPKGTGTPPPDTTVYIAGNIGTNAVLWKNGVPDTLSSTISTANQVFVSGTDVYVAGISQGILNSLTVAPDIASGQYVYWKNGTQNNIDTPQAIGHPGSVAIAGTDVYYANGYAWKNGAMISLPGIAAQPTNNGTGNNGQGTVITNFAAGTDIYFAGIDSLNNGVYWKNGNYNLAAPYGGRGTTLPLVSTMYVSGNDVYVGGMAVKAVYWLNGTANFLPPRSDGSFVSNFTSIFVSGTDVYTTGFLFPTQTPSGAFLGPAYWKNGVENDLQVITPPGPFTFYTTTSVFVLGPDVYVAGFSSYYPPPYTTMTDTAVYWKNGVETSLHKTGQALSIYVQAN